MWIISKEGLIVLGVIAAIAALGLVLVLLPPRAEAPSPPASVTPATNSPANPPAAVPAPTVAPAPVPTVVPAPSTPPPVTPAPVIPAPVAVLPVLPASGPRAAIDGIIYAGEYAHNTSAAGFEIHWTNDARTLRVGLISPATGYLAIGFDPVNRMEGANFILGAVVDGRATVRDDFGTGPVAHAPDVSMGGKSDILEAAGCEVAGKTYLEFVIPLESGDAMDKVLVPGQSYKVLIAYHLTSDDFDAWHSRRGAGTIQLDPTP